MAIAFTSDIDWAPDPVVDAMLSLFEEYGVKCTLFATHRSSPVAQCDRTRFEIGIHPNFNPLLAGEGGSAQRVLDHMLEMYPEAQGVRSHTMTQNSTLLEMFAARGLRYDANHFLPYWSGIRPFRLWNGMLRIPFNWEDDVHWAYGHGFEDCGLDLEAPGLNVLDFHPIHVFLNTERQSRYDEAKPFYQMPERLVDFRNTSSVPGARDLLVHLLADIRDRNVPTHTMREIADEFEAANGDV